ncbi:MAG: hypothetical protein J6C55_00360 [Oscillospiraceae bacterium]|nr:hypothetical protein [Oscillospiraceae bacterium]
MDIYFISTVIFIYFSWIFIFVYKTKYLNNKYKNLDKELNNLIEQTHIEAVSFEKSKNFIKALQKNLRHQIDCFLILNNNKDYDENLKTEILNCLKDTVDISDMTFYVGDDIVNMLLRKKVRECYYKNITLDVVADLRGSKIKSSHLFLIFSDLIDLAIKYIEGAKNRNQKAKILIRASRDNFGNLENSNFFVMQVAYDVINNKRDIDINQYISENHKNMLDLLIGYYNGILVSGVKQDRIVRTITVPIKKFNKLEIQPAEDFL